MTQLKLIHIASIQLKNQPVVYLFLRQIDPYRFVWFHEESEGKETETSIWGGTVEEAILEGRKIWKTDHFRLIECGFRYTLPERDEVGMNALFHQMVASYSSMNGVYFDEDLGYNCIVQNASQEAKRLWEKFKK